MRRSDLTDIPFWLGGGVLLLLLLRSRGGDLSFNYGGSGTGGKSKVDHGLRGPEPKTKAPKPSSGFKGGTTDKKKPGRPGDGVIDVTSPRKMTPAQTREFYRKHPELKQPAKPKTKAQR